jgi:hypothetical protein
MAGQGLAVGLKLEFRSKWAHEALTRENMSSWAHARTPTPKHSCSSEQIKQGHVPTSCGTPVKLAHLWAYVWLHPSCLCGRVAIVYLRTIQRNN